MTDVQKRMKECVDKLDAAWSNGFYNVEDAAKAAEFAIWVRYAHIFFRRDVDLFLFQREVDPDLAGKAVNAMEAAWRPDDATVAQGDQTGRYDDALADDVVRTLHLAMKGLLDASLKKREVAALIVVIPETLKGTP